jgi:coenzyme PQQ precursor peptide PqqA
MSWTHSYHAMRFPRNCWSSTMKWETPQATDFRFGMEITMYIANR